MLRGIGGVTDDELAIERMRTGGGRRPMNARVRPRAPCRVAAASCSARCCCSCGRCAVKLFDWKPYFLPDTDAASLTASSSTADLIRAAAWVSGTNALVGLVVGDRGGRRRERSR